MDQVLALALLFGLQNQREAREASVSVSRYNLARTQFCDILAAATRTPSPFARANPVGMSIHGKRDDTVPALLQPALAKQAANGEPAYPTEIQKLTDTADAAALIRNGFTAQADGNAVAVLCGPPTNLLDLLALPDAHDWIVSKVRGLVIAAGGFDDGASPDPELASDRAAMRELLDTWPTPVVFAGSELGPALAYPAASFDTDFAWAPNHPVVDVYRESTYGQGSQDVPSQAMAAVLHAVHPDEGYFAVSELGEVTIEDDGRTKFRPAADGNHRYLIFDPAKKQQVLEIYTEMVSLKPPEPRRRFGPPPAAEPSKPDAAKPDPAKPEPSQPVAQVSPTGPNTGHRKGSTSLAIAALAGGLTLGVPFLSQAQPSPDANDFAKTVSPVLNQTCGQCHNARMATAGLNITEFDSVDSIASNRAGWNKILARVEAGEMPPPGVTTSSPEQLDAMAAFVRGAIETADASAAPDPGRITAHRLNRNEYSNTVRDLLGVNFRADRYFPTDDSGDGFDNIGEVLTVSPVLMDRYLNAAERIAKWTLSTDVPPAPIEFLYHRRDGTARFVDRSLIEADHTVEFGGLYKIRIGLAGERGKDAAPATLGFWMDGELLHSMQVETKPSGLVYFNPYSEEELELYLPPGDHVFRTGFINDEFVYTLSDKDLHNRDKNKFAESITLTGPFPSAEQNPGRARVLICDPASGRACVQRIVSTLAQRAYRRPVTDGEVAALMRFVDLSAADGESAEDGIQLVIQAILVSPQFLFHIERDPDPTDPEDVHHVSQFELASRLSYFLWSSMPDEELYGLAEAGRLYEAGVLDAQVDRMLADPRSAALADNFAGQWLETRNLDVVKPDPDKFPEWSGALREAMKTETRMFFEYVLRENRPVSEFLDADYTFLNDTLAKHYGIEGVNGGEFRRVELVDGNGLAQRGGVLSQAGVLTVSSYATRTSPVIRGKYVLNNIFGTPPPPPPPDVPALDEAAIGATMSMREQLELHRQNAVCASCHGRMDPLGFGLENYDAVGKWREMDGNFPVDASGKLPNGNTFSTPSQMRELLISQLPEFSRNLTRKMMTYALGRGMEAADDRTVDELRQALEDDGYHFQTLIHKIVNSLPFQSRRGEKVSQN